VDENMGRYFILKDDKPVQVDSVIEWANSIYNHKVIDRTKIRKGVEVSTVFLGLNHSWLPGARPILFETMIFGGPHDMYQERYTNIELAEEGHKRAVKLAKGK
jgi:hypothetical protein